MSGITYDRLSDIFNKLRPKGVNTAPLVFYSEKGKLFGAMKLARPLDIAARANDMQQAQALLDKGANPNLITHVSGPAIKEAAQKGHLAMVKMLHARGGDINVQDSAGGTAMHAVISDIFDFNKQEKKEKLEVLDYLLSNGANMDLKNSCNMTPLEWARMLVKPDAEQLIAKHLGFAVVDELAPSKQPDGTYVFPVTNDGPGSLTLRLAGLRNMYQPVDLNSRTTPAASLAANAVYHAELIFGLGQCEAFVRSRGTETVVQELGFSGDYELVLIPEAVLRQRAQAAADEKAAFKDKLDSGLPTDGKVKGLKPISFRKPAP